MSKLIELLTFYESLSMARSVLMVVHQPTSHPGLVGDMLCHRGYTLDIRCPATGDRLPETLQHHDAVVMFGGPMSANDDTTLPFIKDELNWIPLVLDTQTPFLGICLGAQLLARTLGATVAPHVDEQVEIGYFPIYATQSGQSLFNNLPFVYHWHREGFDIPRSATLLATGSTFRHQAFRYGKTAYGLQFHPEMTAYLMEQWTTKAAEQLSQPGAQSPDEQLLKHRRYGPAVEQWLHCFLDQWLIQPKLYQAS